MNRTQAFFEAGIRLFEGNKEIGQEAENAVKVTAESPSPAQAQPKPSL